MRQLDRSGSSDHHARSRGHTLSLALLAGVMMLASSCQGISSSRTGTPTGLGKPSIVLGEKSSTEQHLLGELYAQAFRAIGYVVDLVPDLGDTQQVDAAFRSRSINAYPEYLGELATNIAGQAAPLSSESQAEEFARQYEQGHGATVMMPVTPFSNSDQLVTLASFAKQRTITTIDQLKSLPFRLKFGDYATEETQYAGFAGLEQAYGLNNLQFVPLATGASIYDALDKHLVQVGDGYSTDPQLTSGTYVALKDPKNIFGFQHVALIIDTALLNRLGPQFQQVYTAVTSLLTVDAMRTMNSAVVIDNQVPASVAHSFLLANHLVNA